MLQNASYFSSAGADVYLTFTPAQYPLRESLEWGRAAEIANDAFNDPGLDAAVAELSDAWKNRL